MTDAGVEPLLDHSASRVSRRVSVRNSLPASSCCRLSGRWYAAILIYLHHNVNVLAMWQMNVRELLPIDASFFQYWVVVQQGYLGFFLAMLVGPPLVSRDLTNNALPLYLCRPFSRTEYVVGKMAVVMILLSAMTWIPDCSCSCFSAISRAGRGSRRTSRSRARFSWAASSGFFCWRCCRRRFPRWCVGASVARGTARRVLHSVNVCGESLTRSFKPVGATSCHCRH